MRKLPFFIILALVLLPISVLAVPVSYVGTVDYEGNLASGHVLRAMSATGTTEKTIFTDTFLINHLGNEGETVSFYFDGMKVKESIQSVPGSIRDLGELFVPGSVSIASKTPSDGIVNMSEMQQTTFSVSAVDSRNASFFSYLWYKDGKLVSNQSTYTFVGNNSNRWSTAGNYTISVIVSNEAGSRANASWKLNVERISDVDGDGIPDTADDCPYTSGSCTGDLDGDGTDDIEDRIIGNESFITTNIDNMDLRIGAYSDVDNQTVSGVNSVIIMTGADPIVQFNFNFTNNTMETRNITIKKQESNTTGSIIVTGIDLTSQGTTKTVYVDRLNSSSNSVCIKDAEILSVTEISASCSGASEYLVRCNNTAQYGYTCSNSGSRYMISGLHHSGILESYKAPETATGITSDSTAAITTATGGVGPTPKIEITGQTAISQVAGTYVSYTVSVSNKDTKSDTYTMTITGIQSSWYMISEPVTIASKGSKTMTYALDLPENATDSTFTVKVASGSGYSAEYKVSLGVVPESKKADNEPQTDAIATITGNIISTASSSPVALYVGGGALAFIVAVLIIRQAASRRKPWNTNYNHAGITQSLKAQIKKAVNEDE